MSLIRTRWAAIGAAVAVTLGAGGLGLVQAANPEGALTFVPITPCRVLDTRPTSQVGPKATPLAAGVPYTVATRDNPGECTTNGAPTIPPEALGVALNVTALNATAGTFLTIYPSDQQRPNASSLNPQPGAPPIPNGVVTDLSPGLKFDVFNANGTVDVLVDINGYYVDHDHDDLYYTIDEINAITELTPIAAGFVNANGTAGRTVGVDSTVWVPLPLAGKPDNGRYEIQLTGIDFSVQEYATTVVANCGGADASVLDGGAVDTRMYVLVEKVGSADTLGQCGFSFTVTKLPNP